MVREFIFFVTNMIIKSILDLCWHAKELGLILDLVRGLFTFRLKGTRGLLNTLHNLIKDVDLQNFENLL